MRIVSVDRFYAPVGGKERYQFELAELLGRHGHAVYPFALAEPENVPSAFEGYFAPALAVHAPGIATRSGAALQRAYNKRAARALERLIDDTRPDIAHIHCLHHLSIAVVRLLRERGIPAVFTLHDYQLICPVATFYRDGAICEECRVHRYGQAVRHRCSHGKLSNSLAAAVDSTTIWLSGELASVRRFIAPSRFAAEKYAEFGFAKERIATLPCFAPVDKWQREPLPARGPIVFAGRLHRLKGAHVLLEALARVGLAADQEVAILGDGPERSALEAQAGRLLPGRVTFTGHLDHAAIRAWYARSIFAVVPSVWHEVLGFAALEPAAVGRPVIASRSGGLPEVVDDGVSGLLVAPGDPEALAGAIRRLLADPSERARMGDAARARAESAFNPDAHYNTLLTLYDDAIRG